MSDQGTAKYNLIQYEVKKDLDTGKYKIEGDQYTVKLFLELMNRYLVQDKWVYEPIDKEIN